MARLDVTTASIAKYWVTELQSEVVDKCLQLPRGIGLHQRLPNRPDVSRHQDRAHLRRVERDHAEC